MLRLSLADRTFVRLVAFLFVTAFSAIPSSGQTQDFVIMVHGPWQFVDGLGSNNNDRLFVVAPQDVTHLAYLWPGTDASMGYWMKGSDMIPGEVRLPSNTPTMPSVYSLDFPGGTVDYNSTPHGKRALVYQTTTHVLPGLVQSVLHPTGTNISRYAISLPRPSYVKTYTGNIGKGAAEAEAEIGNGTFDGSITPATYATWTVLHYIFDAARPVSMNVKVDDTPQGSIAAEYTADVHRYFGISIVLMEAPLCKTIDRLTYYPACSFANISPAGPDDKQCDKLSGLSFSLSAKLWGLNESALFPTEKDDRGNQNPGDYDYECVPYSKTNLATVITEEMNVASRNLGDTDISTPISALDAVLTQDAKARASRPGHRLKANERREDSGLSTDFTELLNDLKLIFPDGIPSGVTGAYNCLCKDLNNANGSVCQLLNQADRTSTSCTTGDAELQTIVAAVSPADKGSSDCHSPQISINNAIQP